VKITGTLPSLASSSPSYDSDPIAIPTRSCVEHSSLTSLIDQPLVSDTLPSLSVIGTSKEVPDITRSEDVTNNDDILNIMDFPDDQDDMELGNFLLDAADWL